MYRFKQKWNCAVSGGVRSTRLAQAGEEGPHGISLVPRQAGKISQVRRQSLYFRPITTKCGQLRRLRLLLVLLGLLLVLELELELGLGQEVGRGLVPQTGRYDYCHSTVADFVWPNSSKIP